MFRQFGKVFVFSRPAFKNLLRHPWILGGFGSVALLGMVTASAIVSHTDSVPEPVRTVTVLEQLVLPAVVPVDSGVGEFVREERIQRSDTLSSLLSRLGVKDPKALAFISYAPEAGVIARQLRPGKTVTAKTGADGRLASLHFPINGKDSMLVVERKGDKFTASERETPLSTRIHVNSGEIVSSLFGATDEAGIPDVIATQLAEIFGSDIDFYRDLRKGDKFSVVFETLTHNGQYFRSGRILAAEFINSHKIYQAYWFQTEDGKEGYYSGEGKNLRKTFLKSPLEFSRVTSGFSNARLHPVLQVMRGHRGVDYGAPVGTLVRAVADGVVEFSGWQGGYGNLIVLRHQGSYSTAYGHMNGFAPEIRKGARVNQGDTIGFVGQTGLASGPHLHYEFRVNGEQIDPMAIALPDPVPLDDAQLARFKAAIPPLLSYLDLARQAWMLASIE
ncbi:MAG: peptidoglycan DD-metalloendopeptidase family protein [Candidatus Accumulibacter sp.]|jgi:murein DD-endopeptidase MepM/ murein hydrolase activator NlpD|nr:peptidoglycan DD-metalloendopeptidase family protein [Accumulibacter sp.]